MVEIWLTHDAEDAFKRLQEAAPAQAAAVARTIDAIADDPGRPIKLPGVRSPEPLRVLEAQNPRAPVVIYRQTSRTEHGDWLVVSLLDRESYQEALDAERELAGFPPATQRFINTAVGTAAANVAGSVHFHGPTVRDAGPEPGEDS